MSSKSEENTCPHCGNVEVYPVRAGSGELMHCDECGASWDILKPLDEKETFVDDPDMPQFFELPIAVQENGEIHFTPQSDVELLVWLLCNKYKVDSELGVVRISKSIDLTSNGKKAAQTVLKDWTHVVIYASSHKCVPEGTKGDKSFVYGYYKFVGIDYLTVGFLRHGLTKVYTTRQGVIHCKDESGHLRRRYFC